MLRHTAFLVLCISSLAACTQAQQPSVADTPGASTDAGLRLLERPVTVLDYVLFQMDNSLKESVAIVKGAEFWEGSSVSGLVMPTDVNTMAFVADSGKIVLGYDIATGRMTRPERDVCEFALNVASGATGADITSRKLRTGRDNYMSHFMPRSTGALAGREARSSAYDELQRRMTVLVTIYERSRRSSTTCERPALSDSISIRHQSVGSGG